MSLETIPDLTNPGLHIPRPAHVDTLDQYFKPDRSLVITQTPDEVRDMLARYIRDARARGIHAAPSDFGYPDDMLELPSEAAPLTIDLAPERVTTPLYLGRLVLE